jgi:hypothetical protein
MPYQSAEDAMSIEGYEEDIELIGIREFINVVLVHEDIRPAMLIQPIDYQEKTHDEPRTNAKLKAIERLFPSLFISTDYGYYQGAIISKSEFGAGAISSDSEMGRVLGYPCAAGFRSINRNTTFYQIDTTVSLKEGVGAHQTQLFANMCSCPDPHVHDFNNIAEQINLSQNPFLTTLVQQAYLKVSEWRQQSRTIRKGRRSRRCRHYQSTVLWTTSRPLLDSSVFVGSL